MEKVKRLPSGHWINENNQRYFLLQFAKKLNITSPDQWGKVTARMVLNSTSGIIYEIKEHGGSSLLQRFEGSPSKLFQAVFPGTSVLKL